ncbi:hypothetical protein GCM10010406_25660 [Streptomyces thermolineatus]|uniref:CDP-diacylglycerol diphosphatase n=1 Tax=Streptomyces thermolineatus TaxID=44033 RepID=A0ABN3LQB5_9ACTN
MTVLLSGAPALSQAKSPERLARDLCSATRATQGAQATTRGKAPLDVGPVALCGSNNDSGGRNGLWDRVKQCRANHNTCLKYTSNYILLRGSAPATNNYLLIPNLRIKGIECPYLWSNANPPKHYWRQAWDEAHHNPAHVRTVNGQGVGLGVNALYSTDHHRVRTQDQLHIHMANIRAGVRGTLDNADARITDQPNEWATSIVSVGGRNYRVLKLRHAGDLDRNLFKLLHDHVVAREAGGDMARQMMVVTRRPKGGYYVLNSEATLPQGRGTSSADRLLDYY